MVRVLAIGGSVRAGSTSELLLRYAATAAADAGAQIDLIVGRELDLPAYEPGSVAHSAAACRFIAALRAADGLLIACPAYHGGIPGLVKNALDHAEDLRDDARPYLDGLAVGCITVAGGAQGAASALADLRTISHALRAWPTPLGVSVVMTEGLLDERGRPAEEPLRVQLALLARQVVQHAQQRRSGAVVLEDEYARK